MPRPNRARLRTWFPATALATVSLIASLATGAGGAAAEPGTGQADSVVQAAGGHRSGLPWNSGVYIPGAIPSSFDQFGAWRGHRVDVAAIYTGQDHWSQIVDPDWLYRMWSRSPMTRIVSMAPIPIKDDSATMAKCARGRYNSKWASFAKHTKAAGMDRKTVIRLGWEFNGSWQKWAARNPDQFIRCWRNIVGTAERYAPKLRWDWTVNRGQADALHDARKAYPGNKYVDIVGIDSYDMWPPVVNGASWNQHLNGKYGLNYWRDFAKAHRKRLSVPEWGIYPGTSHSGHNGGDNSYYIRKMHGFFEDNAWMMSYEAYFNESAPYYGGSLFGPNQNPKASAAYRSVF